MELITHESLAMEKDSDCGCMDETDAFTVLRTDVARIMANQRRMDATLWRIETAVCLGILLVLVRGNIRGIA